MVNIKPKSRIRGPRGWARRQGVEFEGGGVEVVVRVRACGAGGRREKGWKDGERGIVGVKGE